MFGELFIDAIRRQDVEQWLDGAAKRVESGEYSPVTVNNWLRQVKVIMSAAAREFEWTRDPVAGIEYLDTTTHATYTEEQPNSLSPDEVARFLALIKERPAALRHGGPRLRDGTQALEPAPAAPPRPAGRRALERQRATRAAIPRVRTRGHGVHEAGDPLPADAPGMLNPPNV